MLLLKYIVYRTLIPSYPLNIPYLDGEQMIQVYQMNLGVSVLLPSPEFSFTTPVAIKTGLSPTLS